MNDYISRQATLTLKYNGIYIVESTEDKGKLAWKFEYLVEDRWIPETGRIMDGEKVRRDDCVIDPFSNFLFLLLIGVDASEFCLQP